jgi:hypothetical protein
MTSYIDRIPLEKISKQARDINLWRVLLVLLSLPFLMVGWAVWGLLFAVKWVSASVLIGYQDAEKRFGHGASG